MKNLIKICGLSTPQAVDAARDGGASHLGFIFFEKSPRHVSEALAGELAQAKGNAQTVAVTVNADDTYLTSIVDQMKPDVLQLHGSEDIARVEDVRSRFGLPIIKALAIRSDEDLKNAAAYAPHVDLLLLDAKPPVGSDLPGGNGVSFDWSLVTDFQTETPVLLSGGIDLNSVAEAMGHVQNPANAIIGLDVSSGVESAPGVKDIVKIEAFLAACRK